MEQRHDWSDGERFDDEAGLDYAALHLTVGELAHRALEPLSVDVDKDEHAWTRADVDALSNLFEIDWLGSLMVPPASTSLDNRTEANDLLRSLRNALPFADAERWWLLTEVLQDASWSSADKYASGYLDFARKQTTTLITGGIKREIDGGDLLERFWCWRRQTGDYAGGEGLCQANDALRGLVELLTPDLSR
ncbi:MAG TPA: hypothetical protein VF245_05915 [Solirubrobacterales bacterium]